MKPSILDEFSNDFQHFSFSKITCDSLRQSRFLRLFYKFKKAVWQEVPYS